jgi:hypothetical protein
MVESRFRFKGRCVTGSSPSERNPPVAPNFLLREFVRNDGSHFIHPNLILALQNIRNLYRNTVTIVEVDENRRGARGLCATIRARDVSQLNEVCSRVLHNAIISKLIEDGTNLFLEARFSPPDVVTLKDALETAFYVTSGFETSGDPFQQVTGNFDTAGLSFGPSQVNFKTGTLLELFRRFEQIDPETLRGCFTAPAHWAEWCDVCVKPPDQQILWADRMSTGHKKQFLVNPWRGYLQAVGRVPSFRAEMLSYSVQVYGAKLRAALKWLRTVWPHPITELRCFCALFDLCTQQGSLAKAHAEITARLRREKPQSQKEAVRIAVEERAKKADPPWRAVSMSRRLGILYGAPVSVTENGETAKADTAYFSLLPEIEVEGIQQFLHSQYAASQNEKHKRDKRRRPKSK